MEIQSSEVESVKTIGMLHGDEVKLVKTFGGYQIAIGKKKKTSKKSEALAAGSHAGLVSHQLCKEYGSDFEPAIYKNESEQLEKVESKTDYLPAEMIAKGVELFTLTKGNKFEFLLTKHNLTIGQYSAEVENKSLILKNGEFNTEILKADKKTANAMSRAIKDKAYDLNLKEIKRVK